MLHPRAALLTSLLAAGCASARPEADAAGPPDAMVVPAVDTAAPDAPAVEAPAEPDAPPPDLPVDQTEARVKLDAAPPDGPVGACITSSQEVTWMAGLANDRRRLELVATGGAIALALRRSDALWVRVQRPGGQFIAEARFHPAARLLRWGEDGFLVVSLDGPAGLMASIRSTDLTQQSQLSIPGTGTEVLTAAAMVGGAPLALTTERFINLDTRVAVSWTALLGEQDAKSLREKSLYGVAAGPDRLLVAWGGNTTLGLAALSPAGTLLAKQIDDKFFDFQGQYGASVVPHPGGMWLFNGNPVRLTQIGFDLARANLGTNEELRTFYRTVPLVAGFAWQGRAVGFWLTVFPDPEYHQDTSLHQVYGCRFQPGSAKCDRKVLVAETGLLGYGIANEPMAAAALAGDAGFAVAHGDAQGRTWLRVGDPDCL